MKILLPAQRQKLLQKLKRDNSNFQLAEFAAWFHREGFACKTVTMAIQQGAKQCVVLPTRSACKYIFERVRPKLDSDWLVSVLHNYMDEREQKLSHYRYVQLQRAYNQCGYKELAGGTKLQEPDWVKPGEPLDFGQETYTAGTYSGKYKGYKKSGLRLRFSCDLDFCQRLKEGLGVIDNRLVQQIERTGPLPWKAVWLEEAQRKRKRLAYGKVYWNYTSGGHYCLAESTCELKQSSSRTTASTKTSK